MSLEATPRRGGSSLEKDTREDNAIDILTALRMVKGVASVSPHVTNLEQWSAEWRARIELSDKLWKVLYPELVTGVKDE